MGVFDHLWRQARQTALVAMAILLALGLTLGVGSQAAQAQHPASRWQVSITIDDIPMAGLTCPTDAVRTVNEDLLETLASHKVRAAAFFVPGSGCSGDGEVAADALAGRWRAAGHLVGNHSYSHQDYNDVGPEAYISDAQLAHNALEPVLARTGQQGRWFRPPYLHAGADLSRLGALTRWMGQTGHRMGVVTIDNQEWVYARAYDHAVAADDEVRKAAIAAAYLEHMLASADYYRRLSRQVLGREIPQVLLIHANRLNADRLDDLLDAYARTGADFVPFNDALADPAYGEAEIYVGRRGLSWLQRWAISRGIQPPLEPREHAWVADAAR